VVTWKFLEPYVPVEPDALILDAGGGTGRWSIRMARKGCRVVLLDASEGMLRVAARRVEDEGLQRRVIVKKGDIAEGGFGDETFDMVLCEHALFLFEEPDVVLRELRRVLKKKCRLIISAQNRLFSLCLLCRTRRVQTMWIGRLGFWPVGSISA